jgi:ketosteroid isomerase-like protein
VSQENVEICKRAVDAFNRRDLHSYDEIYTVDFEWFPAMPMAVEREAFQGRNGIERYFDEIARTWDAFVLLDDEYRDGGSSLLLLARLQARGSTSGVSLDSPFAAIFDLVDGRCARCRGFLDVTEALKAVGLEE